jgi:hypothetical protein
MKSVAKLYKYHVANLRAVAGALDHVARSGRESLARRRESEVPTFVRLHAFLLGAWAECRLLKLLHERKAFTDADRQRIVSQSTALDRWTTTIELAFRKHYGVSSARLSRSSLPPTAFLRYASILEIVASELKVAIELRNKLAHGQWIYPLNHELTEVSQTQMDALRLENLFTLEQKRRLIEVIAALVNDLVISRPAFERDFDKHYRIVTQTQINLVSRDYQKWVSQLRTSYERGVIERRQGPIP